MTLTIKQYKKVDKVTGAPIEPPEIRSTAQALGAAFKLDAACKVVRIAAKAACYLRLSFDGSAATSADEKLAAEDVVELKTTTDPATGRPMQVYGTAA